MVDLKRIRWDSPNSLSPGKHVLVFDFKYEGLGKQTLEFDSLSGLGKGGEGTLIIDGNVVARHKLKHTLPFVLEWDETFDIGSDTGTSVHDKDYQAPFPFTGTLSKLTVVVDRPELSTEDIRLLEKKSRRDNEASE